MLIYMLFNFVFALFLLLFHFNSALYNGIWFLSLEYLHAAQSSSGVVMCLCGCVKNAHQKVDIESDTVNKKKIPCKLYVTYTPRCSCNQNYLPTHTHTYSLTKYKSARAFRCLVNATFSIFSFYFLFPFFFFQHCFLVNLMSLNYIIKICLVMTVNLLPLIPALSLLPSVTHFSACCVSFSHCWLGFCYC